MRVCVCAGRMHGIFNCCHGVLEQHTAKWICATQPSEENIRFEEEVIGEDHVAYNKAAMRKGQHPGAPLPLGGKPEEEKESAKQRLQRLIRDFAHDAVGIGLPIEAESPNLAAPGSSLEVTLRMDRRLSRIELWPPNIHEATIPCSTPTLQVSLQSVSSIIKGKPCAGGAPVVAEPPSGQEHEEWNTREACTLTIVRRGAADLRLIFESCIARDRAYTCMRIFQMSVDQSSDSQGHGGDGFQCDA